jgi:predicted lipoprotein with Yx(FWY)xxD motif
MSTVRGGLVCAAVIACLSGVVGAQPIAADARSTRAATRLPADGTGTARLARDPAVASAALDTERSGSRPVSIAISAGRAAFGTKMIDSRGLTVYFLSSDRAERSICSAACRRVWVPVRSPGGKPHAGTGFRQSDVGSIQRSDGSDQVTFDGFPLYYFTGDKLPGETGGEGRTVLAGTASAVPPSSATRAASS